MYKPFHRPFILNTRILNKATEHTHLGLDIGFTRVYILRKFRFILNRKTLEKIYLTFIRPTLEYACVVWDNNTLFLINELENVQIEAARIVTGGTR